MTPRTDVDWIDVDADAETIRQTLAEAPHSRFPVADGSVDRLIGVVQARDIVTCLIERRPLDLRALMRPAPIVPDQLDAMDTLNVLREAEVPMAFVHDEYGHFEGLVTPGRSAHRARRRVRLRSGSRHRSAAGRARRRQLVGVGLGFGRHAVGSARHRLARGPRLCDRGRASRCRC